MSMVPPDTDDEVQDDVDPQDRAEYLRWERRQQEHWETLYRLAAAQAVAPVVAAKLGQNADAQILMEVAAELVEWAKEPVLQEPPI